MTQKLIPQFFEDTTVTLLPAIDFYEEAKKKLPMIYQNARNFMALIKSICEVKQELYNIMRSLANTYNLYSSGSPDPYEATPQGVYLKMLASDLTAPFNENDEDYVIFESIVDRINSVVSRGNIKSFEDYFEQNDYEFNNNTVQVIPNATIFFNVPIPNLSVPFNPLDAFKRDIFRIKGAGIRIIVNSTANIPFFRLANTSGYIPPESAGFAGLDAFGRPIGGGYFSAQIPID